MVGVPSVGILLRKWRLALSDIFDFEQNIMKCWNVTDDIDLLIDAVCDGESSQDDLANALIGMKALYQMKFEKYGPLAESKEIANNQKTSWVPLVLLLLGGFIAGAAWVSSTVNNLPWNSIDKNK